MLVLRKRGKIYHYDLKSLKLLNLHSNLKLMWSSSYQPCPISAEDRALVSYRRQHRRPTTTLAFLILVLVLVENFSYNLKELKKHSQLRF